uniref:Uncharacterized protein n=1 Tax=Aegilops tauschii subsp. strangulata TaxID=200361 RepID=A0A453FRG7_AEGTS
MQDFVLACGESIHRILDSLTAHRENDPDESAIGAWPLQVNSPWGGGDYPDRSGRTNQSGAFLLDRYSANRERSRETNQQTSTTTTLLRFATSESRLAGVGKWRPKPW